MHETLCERGTMYSPFKESASGGAGGGVLVVGRLVVGGLVGGVLVGGGGKAGGFFEVAGKIVYVFEAALFGDFADGQLFFIKQTDGVEELQVHDVLVQGHAGALLDDAADIIGVETKLIGNIFVGGVGNVIVVDVLDDFFGGLFDVEGEGSLSLAGTIREDIRKKTAYLQFRIA